MAFLLIVEIQSCQNIHSFIQKVCSGSPAAIVKIMRIAGETIKGALPCVLRVALAKHLPLTLVRVN